MNKWRGWIVLMAGLLVAGSAYSQTAPGANFGQLLKYMFGENKSFTAKQEVKMEGTQNAKEIYKGVIAMLDGNMRTEMETGDEKVPDGRETWAKVMKRYQIIRFDRKVVYLVFPGVKSYVEMSIPPRVLAGLDSLPKVETTELGKETIGGHACIKNKLVITGEADAKQELVVWNATDLNSFPLQFQINEGGSTVTAKFTEVKLDKPDAKLFEPPADMEKCKSIAEVRHKAVGDEMPEEAPQR